MWDSRPLRHIVQRMFFKFSPQFVLLTLHMSTILSRIYQGSWSLHNLWNLLTINLKIISFYNSLDWSGLYLQVHIPSWSRNIFRFTVSRKCIYKKSATSSLAWSDHLSVMILDFRKMKTIWQKRWVVWDI